VTTNRPSRIPSASLLIGSLLLTCAVLTVGALAQTKREVSVTALKHQFRIAGHDKAEIHVTQDDLVRITLTSEDIPHSFTLPDYRIQKRVEPGKDVTFEFRAEKVGRFEFYCSMTADSCRERGMVGTLIVAPKP
jgi:heme/copper-type cytochrome/quinol oxidase subunit 2